MKENNSKLVHVLISIIVILLIVGAYFFVMTRKYRMGYIPDAIKTYSKYIFDNTPYVMAKGYSYTTNGITWTGTFVGYENKQTFDQGTKSLPAFSMTDPGKNLPCKLWDIHRVVLYPDTNTSELVVEELTKNIGGKIIDRPGDTSKGFRQEYYYIELPDKQNTFDAVAYYKKYVSFKFIEPDWMIEGNLN